MSFSTHLRFESVLVLLLEADGARVLPSELEREELYGDVIGLREVEPNVAPLPVPVVAVRQANFKHDGRYGHLHDVTTGAGIQLQEPLLRPLHPVVELSEQGVALDITDDAPT